MTFNACLNYMLTWNFPILNMNINIPSYRTCIINVKYGIAFRLIGSSQYKAL